MSIATPAFFWSPFASHLYLKQIENSSQDYYYKPMNIKKYNQEKIIWKNKPPYSHN